MSADWTIAIHEAGHAVVGWYFGMMPTSMTFVGDDGKPCTIHDRVAFVKSLPGEGLVRNLLDSSITSVRLAAGGCAELAIGIEHEKCGWNSDFRQFEKYLEAVSKICGYSYDYCWALISAMAKGILADDQIWSSVEELAKLFVNAKSLTSDELAAFFAGRQAKGCANRVEILLDFVDTPQARVMARSYAAQQSLLSGSV